MRLIAALALVTTVASAAAPAAARAQVTARIDVAVVDDADGLPIANAQVRVTTASMNALTNSSGRVELGGIPPGQHIVVVQRLGYDPETAVVEFTSGGTVEAEFRLRVRAVALDEVEVRADRPNAKLDRSGFYDRHRTNGFGTFLGEEEIAQRLRRGATTTELLRTMRGLRVVQEEFAKVVYTSRSNDSILLGPCTPDLYVDGVRVRLPRDDRGRVLLDLEHIIPLPQVAAIEVYTGGASAPAGLGGGFGCGSIVFWTLAG